MPSRLRWGFGVATTVSGIIYSTLLYLFGNSMVSDLHSLGISDEQAILWGLEAIAAIWLFFGVIFVGALVARHYGYVINRLPRVPKKGDSSPNQSKETVSIGNEANKAGGIDHKIASSSDLTLDERIVEIAKIRLMRLRCQHLTIHYRERTHNADVHERPYWIVNRDKKEAYWVTHVHLILSKQEIIDSVTHDGLADLDNVTSRCGGVSN